MAERTASEGRQPSQAAPKGHRDREASERQKAAAGWRAEAALQHYLKRALADRASVHLISGLRVEFDGEAAEIDHLVVSRYGMVIVESKSVSTRVRINEFEEWSRLVDGEWRGMASPIIQCGRQAELLKRFLVAKAPHLISRYASLGLGFRSFLSDAVVAISDNGIIERPAGMAVGTVLKADQVPERVREIIGQQRWKTSFWANFWRKPRELKFKISKREAERIAAFLRASHAPRAAAEASE